MRVYLTATIYTILALFGLGAALWAMFFLIEGAVAFGGGSLLEYELIALPFTALLFLASAFTFGLIYAAPLTCAGVVLFWALGQVFGERRALAVVIGLLTSWAAGLHTYLTDIQNMPGQNPVPAMVLYSLIGLIAGSVFWAILSGARDRRAASGT